MSNSKKIPYLQGAFTHKNNADQQYDDMKIEKGKNALREQMDKLRAQFQNSKKNTEEERRKYYELLKLNKIITQGYHHNLNVIIDLSHLLHDYRNFIEEIAKTIQVLDKNNNNLPHIHDLDHLNYLTSEKFLGVAKGFDQQMNEIEQTSQEHGFDPSKIQNAKKAISQLTHKDTQKEIKEQIIPQKGKGKGKEKEKRKRGRPSKIKK